MFAILYYKICHWKKNNFERPATRILPG